MKIITFNSNGIRSAQRKGFFKWMLKQDADVVCVQETKAQVHQLDKEVLSPNGYTGFFKDAEKKGYSGVALYTRKMPDRVIDTIGLKWADREGRFIQADFDQLSIISIYLPSGSSGEERQVNKFKFMDYFMPVLKKMRKQKRKYIICGDWNIAHKKIDLKNWRGNQKNSGFLPEERAWMTELFDDVGLVDAFRVVNKNEDQYTWWSNRGQAWAKNVGWRIDYQVISHTLRAKILMASIYKKKRFSDHAPLTVCYDLPF